MRIRSCTRPLSFFRVTSGTNISILNPFRFGGNFIGARDIGKQIGNPDAGAGLPPLDEQKAIVAQLTRERARSAEIEETLGDSIKLLKDRRVALITSANFTEAAQKKNIEAGVLIRYEPFVMRLHNYFEGLRNTRQLAECLLRSATTQSP